ncbi:phage protein Gp27 family protein [Parasedimentitalea psychrophila]|uniref:DUF3486 family protein n=1 Tax=Parasedimentitalea psychrophila TaxID=2997337 RepID=A0A9Y2KYJ9_9RHOB|nr:phage protein Gp27 family protein [Parasedimentitalea psychrophila]NRB18326.1 DUF3486 family protein [Paracoccaceae bacterium]WIY25048.1 DUF3486 family protein [Parasedimentitalea psychrophila]
MPPSKKMDLIPAELRQRLAQLLQDRGFGDIMEITEELNSWLDERGEEIRIGKTAVGEFSKLLKSQRDAFAMAETLLSDLDIEGESNMHKVLMQMIATAAFQMMQGMSDKDQDFDPKGLASLSRMLKDLMQSAGMREKLREDERNRVAQKAREDAVDDIEKAATQLGMTKETVQGIREQVLFGGKR